MGADESGEKKNSSHKKFSIVDEEDNTTEKEGDTRDDDSEARRKISVSGGGNPKADPNILINSDVFIGKGNYPKPELIYSKIKKLGSGAFGEVWLVLNKQLNQQFALKIIKKKTNKPNDDREIMNEIKILKTLDHPKILKVHDFFTSSNNYYILTEYCQMGELFKEITKVERFEEGAAAFIMRQVFSVVRYCHGMKIIHRDLKPENIMIVSRESNKALQVKIIDFGTAKIYEKGQLENRLIGTSYYIAPEVIKRNYSEKCDLWSCGVIMYILLTGRAPFEGEEENEIFEKIKKGKYDTSKDPYPSLSKEAKDLISKLLELNPNKRISAAEALEHKWFKSKSAEEMEKVNKISKESAKKMIDNLKKFDSKNALRSTVLAYLVHFNMNLPQCLEASKFFFSLDLNGDGKIDKNEFLEGWKKYGGSKKEVEKEVEEVFKSLDVDYTGNIEYEEFIRGAIDKNYFLNRSYLEFAFSYFDLDSNGELSFDEVKKRFMQNANNANDPRIEKEIKRSFEEFDLNNDEKISFKEFTQMMQKLIK